MSSATVVLCVTGAAGGFVAIGIGDQKSRVSGAKRTLWNWNPCRRTGHESRAESASNLPKTFIYPAGEFLIATPAERRTVSLIGVSSCGWASPVWTTRKSRVVP